MTRRMNDDWPDDVVQVASKMWRDGCSASLIAREIGKSRSAVVGKANRNRSLFPARRKATQTARGMAQPRATRVPSAPGRCDRVAMPSTAELVDDLAAFREPGQNRATNSLSGEVLGGAPDGASRATLARSISCQAVAMSAPIEEIARAVRLGILPEDAEPVAYDAVGASQCRWPVDLSVSEHGPTADKACGAPVVDPVSRKGMARTHCAFHFRALGQDLGKVMG